MYFHSLLSNNIGTSSDGNRVAHNNNNVLGETFRDVHSAKTTAPSASSSSDFAVPIVMPRTKRRLESSSSTSDSDSGLTSSRLTMSASSSHMKAKSHRHSKMMRISSLSQMEVPLDVSRTSQLGSSSSLIRQESHTNLGLRADSKKVTDNVLYLRPATSEEPRPKSGGLRRMVGQSQLTKANGLSPMTGGSKQVPSTSEQNKIFSSSSQGDTTLPAPRLPVWKQKSSVSADSPFRDDPYDFFGHGTPESASLVKKKSKSSLKKSRSGGSLKHRATDLTMEKDTNSAKTEEVSTKKPIDEAISTPPPLSVMEKLQKSFVLPDQTGHSTPPMKAPAPSRVNASPHPGAIRSSPRKRVNELSKSISVSSLMDCSPLLPKAITRISGLADPGIASMFSSQSAKAPNSVVHKEKSTCSKTTDNMTPIRKPALRPTGTSVSDLRPSRRQAIFVDPTKCTDPDNETTRRVGLTPHQSMFNLRMTPERRRSVERDVDKQSTNTEKLNPSSVCHPVQLPCSSMPDQKNFETPPGCSQKSMNGRTFSKSNSTGCLNKKKDPVISKKKIELCTLSENSSADESRSTSKEVAMLPSRRSSLHDEIFVTPNQSFSEVNEPEEGEDTTIVDGGPCRKLTETDDCVVIKEVKAASPTFAVPQLSVSEGERSEFHSLPSTPVPTKQSSAQSIYTVSDDSFSESSVVCLTDRLNEAELDVNPCTPVHVASAENGVTFPRSALKSAYRDRPSRSERIRFDGIDVFYFHRQQGGVTVPQEGEITLAMVDEHFATMRFPLIDGLRTNISLVEEEQMSEGEELGGDGFPAFEDEKLRVFMCRHDDKKRQSLLRYSGVQVVKTQVPAERSETIRRSRTLCGCSCRNGICRPDSCECHRNGIQCQVDSFDEGIQQTYPCHCAASTCHNPEGRLEFESEKVQTIRRLTLKRLKDAERTGLFHSPQVRTFEDSDTNPDTDPESEPGKQLSTPQKSYERNSAASSDCVSGVSDTTAIEPKDADGDILKSSLLGTTLSGPEKDSVFPNDAEIIGPDPGIKYYPTMPSLL